MRSESPFLNLDGAVQADSEGVAEHYGHPLKESRALEDGKAVVDLSNEAIIRVAGPDRLSWLNSITSQSLDRLLPGDCVETLILSPTGRIEFAPKVLSDHEALLLLVPDEWRAGLIEFLQKMKFMLRVEITDESENFAQVLSFSQELTAKVKEITGATNVWLDPWGGVLEGGHQYREGEALKWQAERIIVSREKLPDLVSAVKAGELQVAGLAAYAALEIAAYRPSIAEVDERSIPHELDWLRTAVHLSKGCYRGQETVAKVHNLGHPPRRLAIIHFDFADGETPAKGAKVFAESDLEKPVGLITRAALHHDLGAIALAVLKRRAPDDEALVAWLPSGAKAIGQQEIIVPVSAGQVREIPRLPRLQ